MRPPLVARRSPFRGENIRGEPAVTGSALKGLLRHMFYGRSPFRGESIRGEPVVTGSALKGHLREMSRSRMGYDPGREVKDRVNETPHIARCRWPAALIALAALFHVQWVAACDLAAPVSGGTCCPESHANAASHCDGDGESRRCMTPFAKGASGLKAPEWDTGMDDAPDELPAVSLLDCEFPLQARARPPGTFDHAVIPDGGRIYLTSSRLRL